MRAKALSRLFECRIWLPPEAGIHGSKIASDAGLLAYRELDNVLGLTQTAGAVLADQRGGKNKQHLLTGLLRPSVYGRLAGNEDVNDADRLESVEVRRSGQRLFDPVHARRPPMAIVPDMDSSDSPTYSNQESSTCNGHVGRTGLAMIGTKVMCHGRYIVFQLAEVAVPRALFGERRAPRRRPHAHERHRFGRIPLARPPAVSPTPEEHARSAACHRLAAMIARSAPKKTPIVTWPGDHSSIFQCNRFRVAFPVSGTAIWEIPVEAVLRSGAKVEM